MAGETVLVVDDAPVGLKLSATVLRGEGYKVHLASTAEQALIALGTFIPDLLLLDLQLPGMDGLELARQLRQDPRTRGMLIVALTASVLAEAEQLAYDAGCDGFIAKPIDTRTLGRRLRTYLDAQSAAAAPDPGAGQGGLPTALSFSGPEMEGLRRSFLAEGSRQVCRLLEFVNSRLDTNEVRRMFHQWVGSAGALGYMEIAQHARAAETLLCKPGWAKSDLRDSLAALAKAFASPREAAETPIPDSIVRELAGQRIALIGFADEEGERLCAAFARVRALPQLFTGAEPPQSNSIRDCSVAMVHVRPATVHIPWLRSGFLPPRPLVLVGGREGLLALPPDVQARACEFLIDGWQPEEAIMRLSFAVARGTPGPAAGAGASPAPAESPRLSPSGKPAVVIADDDMQVLAVVRWALQSLGMECHSATTGTEALHVVCDLRPHAAVLDVGMPGMDGFEVLAAIRHAAMPVKVVMLTASQQQRDVLRGFELGADDYVVKPFHPMELAARLKRLL
jgi:DNA-binding response OmpR family regulator